MWEEVTVSDDMTASEILFKGKDGGTNIVSLTITSLEIYEGTKGEYTCASNGYHSYENGVCTVCGAEEDHCNDLLTAGNVTDNSQTEVTISDGSVTLDSSTSWIAVKLDRTYLPGETVTVHITGTTDATIRWYLSEAYYGSGNITDPTDITDTSGDFDVTYTFTVKTDTTYSGAVYINIKPLLSGVSAFSNLTITHLGIVQYDVTVEDSVGGTVTADKSGANTGETVTLTVTPDTSYELSSLAVTDSTGAEVTVNDDYTFTMPASNVTVTATFADTCETTVTLSTDNLRTEGTATAVDGGLNSSQSLFELKLPETVYEGDTVTVHITGSSDADFRVWLSNGGATASNQVKASDLGYSGSGDFDLTFDLTFEDIDGANITDAGCIMFKGYKFGETLNNLTVTHIGITYPEEETIITPSFYGWSLTLDGKIGVTYYFTADEVEDISAYKLYATVGEDSEQEITAGDTKTISGVTYYRYTVYVSVADINSDISAYLSDGTSTVTVPDYSVATYCSETGESDAEYDLCNALLTYGYYTGVYTNKTTNITGYTDLSEVSIDSETYGNTSTEGYAKSIVLDDKVSIVVYMTDSVCSSDSTFKVGSKTLTPTARSVTVDEVTYSYYIEFDVPAQNLSDMYTICDAEGNPLTTYSVYSYIMNMLAEDSTATGDLKNLCKAIYNYGQVAKSYEGWQ